MKLYKALAMSLKTWKEHSAVIAKGEGPEDYLKNAEFWCSKHDERIQELCQEHLPSGSGFDAGTEFLILTSNANTLFFSSAFHHLNEAGFYDGWTEFLVTVTPSLCFGYDIKIKVKGKKHKDFDADFIADTFILALESEVR